MSSTPTRSRPSTAREALEDAADAAMAAPSVLNSQPWRLVIRHDHLEVDADRSRWIPGVDPAGRLLVQAVGAAVLNARVALAAQGWAVRVDRTPVPGKEDLLARLHPVDGHADAVLAGLAPAMTRTGGTPAPGSPAPLRSSLDERLRSLSAAVVDEGSILFPVLSDEQRRLVDRLTRLAQASQHHDPVVLAAVRYWTRRPAATGEGGPRTTPVTTGDARSVVVVLATHHDDLLAHLRSGEALQRVVLEVAATGGSASPLRPPLELDATRAQLRTAMTSDTWPQSLVQITRTASPVPGTARLRRRSDVLRGSSRASGRAPVSTAPSSPGFSAPG